MGSKPFDQQAEEAKTKTPRRGTTKRSPVKSAVESPQKKVTDKITLSNGGIEDALRCTKSSSTDVADAEKVLHFRNLVTSESQVLNSNCDKWGEIRQQNLQSLEEDIEGEIRSVIGQAQLLMAERFTQFNKLVDKYENPNPEDKPVTPTDLQGFWDMIFFQVEDVAEKFQKLQILKERNWVKEEQKKTSLANKKTMRVTPTKPTSVRNEAARTRLQEAKRAMRERRRLQEEAKKQEAIKDIISQEDCHRSQTKNEHIVTSISKTIEITL